MSLWPLLLVDRDISDPDRCAWDIRRERDKLSYHLHILTRPNNDVVDVISCVALFHEKGKSRNSFLCKEKFRAQLTRKEKILKSVRETSR